MPSVEAHHRVNGPDTGRNSGGRRIKKNTYLNIINLLLLFFFNLKIIESKNLVITLTLENYTL